MFLGRLNISLGGVRALLHEQVVSFRDVKKKSVSSRFLDLLFIKFPARFSAFQAIEEYCSNLLFH